MARLTCYLTDPNAHLCGGFGAFDAGLAGWSSALDLVPWLTGPDTASFGASRLASPFVAQLPEGTVTFLFTDVEGSTRLWEDAPEVMMEALRASMTTSSTRPSRPETGCR